MPISAAAVPSVEHTPERKKEAIKMLRQRLHTLAKPMAALALAVGLLSSSAAALAAPSMPAPPGSTGAPASPVGASPNAVYSISGSLYSGYYAWRGPYYENPGNQVSINISYNPPSSTVSVGLCTSTSFNSCQWVQIGAGSGGHTWTIPSPGNYYLDIWNQGPYQISYTGYISV